MEILQVKLFVRPGGKFDVRTKARGSDGKPMGTFATDIPGTSLIDHLEQVASDLKAMEAIWKDKTDQVLYVEQVVTGGHIKSPEGK